MRSRRTGLTLLGLAATLALVAIASRGSTPGGNAGARGPSDRLLDTLLSFYLVALALGALLLLFIVYLVLTRKTPPTRTLRDSRGRMLASLALILLFGLALSRIASERGTMELPFVEVPAGLPEEGERDERSSTGDDYQPQFAWVPVSVFFGLLAVAVAAFYLAGRQRRRALAGPGDASLAKALATVLEETLDDLRSERDPRAAVIAAYARLERTLGAYGLPRRASEAPVEYLERILRHLSVTGGAIRRLTALYERAKFSQHEVDPKMKDDAIDALQTVQEELRAAALAAAAPPARAAG